MPVGRPVALRQMLEREQRLSAHAENTLRPAAAWPGTCGVVQLTVGMPRMRAESASAGAS
jgi:hypothetical protein